MSSHFKVSKVSNFKEFKEGDVIPESDFSLITAEDKFLQFEFIEEKVEYTKDVEVQPGIWTIAVENQKLILRPTEFTKQSLIDSYVSTKDITSKVDTFFSKIDIYKELQVDAKRGLLLYGPAGTGKSSALSKVAEKYGNLQNTAVVCWPSDKFEARVVKDFLNNFNYEKNNIQQFVLIIEDLGGVEQNSGQRYSESSLLSILDNVERTFTIPTMIIATTNFPEMFLENLTNRPQRFDDLIEVKRPDGKGRAAFLEFFSKNAALADELVKIQANKYEILSPAHIKEIVIRARLYDITISESIDKIFEQAERASKNFSPRRNSMGFGLD